MVAQPTTRKPRRLRRYVIAAGALGVLGSVAYVYAPVASDLVRSRATVERKALARDIVEAAADKLNWTELGRCKGVKDGKPVFVRVLKHKRRASVFRRLAIDEDRNNSLGPVRTEIKPKFGEKSAVFEGRVKVVAEKICGTPLQLKLQP